MAEDPLEHNTRKQIYNHISSNPGVSFSAIKHNLTLSKGTLRYHLNYLEDHEEIRSCLEDNARCYYPVQNVIFDHNSESELKILKLNNTQTLLIETIRRYPGVTQKELVFKTGLNRVSITYNLRKLLDFGVVRKVQRGKFVYYYYISNSELRRNIIGHLMRKFIDNELEEAALLALKERLDGM